MGGDAVGPASPRERVDVEVVFARGVQKKMGWEDDGKQMEEESPRRVGGELQSAGTIP